MASSSGNLDYSCYVWPDDTMQPEDGSRTSVVFSFLLKHSCFSSRIYSDGFSLENFQIEHRLLMNMPDRAFELEHDLMMQKQGYTTCYYIFQEKIYDLMGISCDPLTIVRIMSIAGEMATNRKYENYKVLRLVVHFESYVNMDDDSESEDTEPAIVAASKSSIEKLEMVKIEDDSKGPCSICLDELSSGSEATSMPCCHIFHNGCIVKWLNKNRCCPLCRFELL